MQQQELVFGFLPAPVLQNITELGNWKTRSNAIEQVQRGLASLGPAQTQVLMEQLPGFVAFVQQLLQDHNFKVVTAGLSVLADAASSLGTALQHHMGELTPVVLSKLQDHRAPVAAAALKAATMLMHHTQRSGPAALVNQMLRLQAQQQQGAIGQDCSGLVELLILAMLKGAISSLDLPAAARLLLGCMQQSTASGSSQSSNKQHALALEALALVTDSLGAQLPQLLKQAGGSDLAVAQVLTQVQQQQRPLLAADGSIQHNSTVQAAIAAAEAALPGGSSFRLGSGMYDRTANSSTSSFRSDSSIGGYRSTGLGTSKGGEGDAGAEVDVFSRPFSSSERHEQMLPPGSLGALAAHARLINSASSTIAAATASCGGSSSNSGASRPASGLLSARTQVNGPESRQCNPLQLPGGSSNASHGGQHPYYAGRSPLGSPRGVPGGCSSSSTHGCSHLHPPEDLQPHLESLGSPRRHSQANQLLSSSTGFRTSNGSCSSIAAAAAAASQQLSSTQPQQQQPAQQLQTQLSKLQLYDSSRYASPRQDSQLQQDAAAAVESAAAAAAAGRPDQHKVDSSVDGFPGKLPTGLQAAAGHVPNLRYQQPSNGSTSSNANSLPCRGTADQEACNAASCSLTSATVAAQAGAGSSSSGSWLAAAGAGWAPNDAADGVASSSSPCCSGRLETLSPSRGERLANLKRRQVEKRAVSATGSTRGSFPWDSQDGGLAAAVAAAAAADGTTGLAQTVPRAATAGPGSMGSLGWRFSSGTSASQGAGPGQDHPGYRVSISPCPGEEAATGAASSRAAPLLHWHIPTGQGGHVLPPGAAAANPMSSQQQQQQRQHSGSPDLRATGAGAGAYSPSSSWDSSSLAGSGAAAAAASPQSGQLLQHGLRTVSAAAVLTGTGTDSYSTVEGSNISTTGSLQYRSSRFQHARSGSLSPATASADAGSSSTSGGLMGGSRLNSSGHGSSSSNQGLARQHLQQQQQQQQHSLGMRAQTAAAMLGSSNHGGFAGSQAGGLAAGEWGTGASSSPVSRLGSAGGATVSGCFNGSASGATAGGGPSSASSAGSPTRSPGGIGSRVGSGVRGLATAERPYSVGAAEADLAGSDLAPLVDPETALRQAISRLQQANTATRKEVDWQAQLDALVDGRRLLAHHPEVLRSSARELVLAALPAVDELRSTTARMAMLFFQELPGSGLGLERELDEVVPVLLKKAGDLSTAGRDNFLAQEAAKALSLICAGVSESRALSALIAAGASHKSPHVRSRAAAHLDEVAAGGQGLEALLRSGNCAVLDKVFKTAAGFLQEGSLETRTYGKRLLWAVKAVLRGNRADLDRLMSGITPEGVHRRVVEVLEGLSAPPPPPTNRGNSAAGPRLASRGQASGCSTPTSGSLSGQQTAPPFSAPPAAAFASAGAAAGGQDGPPYSATRPGYSSIGSTSSGSNAARRALFNGAGGLQVQGASAAAAAPGAGSLSGPGSPTLSSSSSRRRSTAAGLADSSRGLGSPTAACSASGSPAGCGGVAPGGVGGVSERRLSGGCPAGLTGPMSPELQEAVEQVGQQLCSKDWRNRMDALRALSALGPALPEVPNAPLEGLLQALVGRLSDGNAKVNQKALEVLCEVSYIVSLRMLLIMSSLMPALTANLGSTNEKLRSCASTALDVVAVVVSPQPQLLLQGFAQAVSNGSVRTKVAVIEKLSGLLPAIHDVQPQLTRLLLPAAFSLALEARGEAKGAASQLLGLLATLLGSTSVLNAAAVVSSATEQRVRELVMGANGRN